jgi:hypothetical protein
MLVFAAPTQPLPIYGPYAVICSLPPMVNNQPSYLSSLVLIEP